ncbi:hypothetical protein ACIBVL_39865 [Streptomyces sp. NPDC049687]|uniref:hypothetical protein n=1 Tax=Streptomyces sp. NPDC049687 TaxID=3365596 RepID=UPI00379B196C
MNATNAGGVRRRSVEIVVPVPNAAHVLADGIGRLHARLEDSFPFPFRVTIADNAVTDAIWSVATGLPLRLPHVHAQRLELKGRGRAQRVDDLRGMSRMLRSTLTGRTRVPAVPRRSSIPQVPAARTPSPAAVPPTGANTHLEYAS